jgi:TonB family protein
MTYKPLNKHILLNSATYTLSLILLTLTASISTFSQQPKVDDELSRGISLYKQGDAKSAVKVLKKVVKNRKNDAEAWYYLGLSFYKAGSEDDARDAYRKAIKLRPDFANAHLALAFYHLQKSKLNFAKEHAEKALALNNKNAEAHYILGYVSYRERNFSDAWNKIESVLAIDEKYPLAYLLKARLILYGIPDECSDEEFKEACTDPTTRIEEASKNLETFFKLSPQDSENVKYWRDYLGKLTFYRSRPKNIYVHEKHRTPDDTSVYTKFKITNKPGPSYTELARKNGITGKVILRAVFDVDGKVKYIIPLRSLGYGLDERAIEAANKIEFVPATKDGQPVPAIGMLEYMFNIY